MLFRSHPRSTLCPLLDPPDCLPLTWYPQSRCPWHIPQEYEKAQIAIARKGEKRVPTTDKISLILAQPSYFYPFSCLADYIR